MHLAENEFARNRALSKSSSLSFRYPLRVFCLLVRLGTLSPQLVGCLLGNEIRVRDGQAWNSPFAYRSILFGTPSRVGPLEAMGTSVNQRASNGPE